MQKIITKNEVVLFGLISEAAHSYITDLFGKDLPKNINRIRKPEDFYVKVLSFEGKSTTAILQPQIKGFGARNLEVESFASFIQITALLHKTTRNRIFCDVLEKTIPPNSKFRHINNSIYLILVGLK